MTTGAMNAAETALIEAVVSITAQLDTAETCRRMLDTLRKTVQGLMTLRAPAPADLGPGIIERLRQERRQP